MYMFSPRELNPSLFSGSGDLSGLGDIAFSLDGIDKGTRLHFWVVKPIGASPALFMHMLLLA
jgi:hypothetical protein